MLENLDLYPKQHPLERVQRVEPPRYYPKSLSDLDLNQELLEVYMKAKYFLQDLSTADIGEIPANQIAQVMNTIVNTLKELARIQTDLYNAEKVKLIEAATIQVIKMMPPETQEAFFEEYKLAMELE